MNSISMAAPQQHRTIGIVTVLFNSDDVLPGFFDSLSRQEEARYQLYIIDNSKTDSGSRLSRQLAAQHGLNATVIFNNANLGVAKGNNQGIELARADACEYILLANNDIEFENPHLLRNLTHQLGQRGLAGIAPKIYYYGKKDVIWFAGGRFSIISATTPHFGDREIDTGQHDATEDIEYAPTCFVLLRTSVFETIGIMDEKYFVYYDDSDFMWRMKQHQLRLGFAANELVMHKVSYSTGGDLSTFSLYYGTRNRIYFIHKNYSWAMKLISLPYLFITRLIKLPSMNKAQKTAVLKGIRDGLQMMKTSKLPNG